MNRYLPFCWVRISRINLFVVLFVLHTSLPNISVVDGACFTDWLGCLAKLLVTCVLRWHFDPKNFKKRTIGIAPHRTNRWVKRVSIAVDYFCFFFILSTHSLNWRTDDNVRLISVSLWRQKKKLRHNTPTNVTAMINATDYYRRSLIMNRLSPAFRCRQWKAVGK